MGELSINELAAACHESISAMELAIANLGDGCDQTEKSLRSARKRACLALGMDLDEGGVMGTTWKTCGQLLAELETEAEKARKKLEEWLGSPDFEQSLVLEAEEILKAALRQDRPDGPKREHDHGLR